MTRKEAAEIIRRADDYIIVKENDVDKDFVMSSSLKEAVDLAVSALCTPTREQVEKMRGEWIGMTDDDGCTWFECSRCEHGLDSLEEPNHFCPACGSPMTDEAVDKVMEKINNMEEITNEH